MVHKCVDCDACFKTHEKLIRVHNTGFHEYILPLVEYNYDLVPGSYRTIVRENAVKVTFTVTSTENHYVCSITVFLLIMGSLIIFSNTHAPDDCEPYCGITSNNGCVVLPVPGTRYRYLVPVCRTCDSIPGTTWCTSYRSVQYHVSYTVVLGVPGKKIVSDEGEIY